MSKASDTAGQISTKRITLHMESELDNISTPQGALRRLCRNLTNPIRSRRRVIALFLLCAIVASFVVQKVVMAPRKPTPNELFQMVIQTHRETHI